MIKFKGRLFFKQFLPAKPIRFGIKQFCLSEASSGYALKFLVYTGKETFTHDALAVPGDFTVTEQVVLKLVEDLHDTGHIIYTDSFYTSPNVVKEMQSQGMGDCQVGQKEHASRAQQQDPETAEGG